MNVPRNTQTATLLQNGQVLVAGGATCCTNGCCSGGSAELYNPATGTWANTGSMSFPRLRAAGGTASRRPGARDLQRRRPRGSPVRHRAVQPGQRHLEPRRAGRAQRRGGLRPHDAQHRRGLDLGRNRHLGSDSNRRIVLQSGATLFDPTTGNPTPTGNMSIPRDGHTLTLLPNGQVLAAGGLTQKNNTTNSTTSVTASAELFTP